MPPRNDTLRIKLGKQVVFYIYVGLGNIPMDKLKTNGMTLEFKTVRERIKFRKMLEEEKPKSMEQIRILYELYSM